MGGYGDIANWPRNFRKKGLKVALVDDFTHITKKTAGAGNFWVFSWTCLEKKTNNASADARAQTFVEQILNSKRISLNGWIPFHFPKFYL